MKNSFRNCICDIAFACVFGLLGRAHMVALCCIASTGRHPFSSSTAVFVHAPPSTGDGGLVASQDCGHPSARPFLRRAKKAFSTGTLLRRVHPEVQRCLRRTVPEDALLCRCGWSHEGDRVEGEEDQKKERREHVAPTKQARFSSGIARNDFGLHRSQCGARRCRCRWHLLADPRANCTLQDLRSA